MKKALCTLLIATMVFTMSSTTVMAKSAVNSSPVSNDPVKVDVEIPTAEFTTGISEDATGAFVNEELGDGMIILDDGTFIAYKDFENDTGKAIGTYEMDGDNATFYSPYLPDGQKDGFWNGSEWEINGAVYSSTFKISPISVMPAFGIYIDGENSFILGDALEDIENYNLKTTEDLEKTMVESGEVYTVDVTLKKATATLQVINQYENTVPLGECMICGIYTEDTSDAFSLDYDGHKCGEDNFDDLLSFNVYEYTEDKLVYKPFIMALHKLSTVVDKAKGKQLLFADGNAELTLNYDGSTLTSFEFTYPAILYNGLNDNIDSDDLASLDASTIAEITKIRSSILDKLETEFKSAHVEYQMDEISGEISMDNEVLFKKNSYEISDEGKDYLDSFISVYGAVLFSDEYIDSISEIHFEGHTDSDGDYGYNQILSQKRAQAVLDYCLESENNGLTDDQKESLEDISTAVGYSCSDLIYDKDGNEDKDASRRAVVKFYINVK